MTYCNLMSVVDGARGTQADDRLHVERGAQFLSPRDEVRRLVVPARTLDWVLLQEEIERLDFLSLDVEGFEAQALLGLNFDRLSPAWILVEANDRPAVHSLLSPRYKLVKQLSHHDLLYKRTK